MRRLDTFEYVSMLKELVEEGKAPEGLILHSDQGRQYSSVEFITFCKNTVLCRALAK